MKKQKNTIISLLLRCFISCLFLTCRWKIINRKKLTAAIQNDRPVVICSWHSRLLYVARFFKNFNFSIWTVSSTHKDSEILAKILTLWKWKLIRGSSTRGWRNVIIKMKQLLQNKGTIIAITNDGPKGPPQIAKKGSIKLALQAEAQIITMSCCASSFWSLSSWDKTHIPKPFSTIYVSFSSPFISKNTLPEEEQITNYLNDNLKELENKFGL